MERYKIIEENCCNGYILDTQENKIVCLIETKRPDLGFDKLKTLIEKANKVKAYEATGLEPEDILSSDEMKEINIKLGTLIDYMNLDEQGLLIKLPCKEGTKIYFIEPRYNGDYVIREACYNLTYYQHINPIFLTREEAERALERRKA